MSCLARRRYGTQLRPPEREPRHVSHWNNPKFPEWAFRAVSTFYMPLSTFYTSSSRAEATRTRHRFLRPVLAPAALRERDGRLAPDTVA